MVHVMWQIQLATQEAIKLQLAKGHVYGWKTFWNTVHVPSLFFFLRVHVPSLWFALQFL